MATRFALAGTFGSVSAAKDVLTFTAPTSGTLRLIELHVTNEADETSEMLPFTLSAAAVGSGVGTAVTPVNLDYNKNTLVSAGAFTNFSAIYNLSSVVTSKTTLVRESCNILSGFHFVPVPESRPMIADHVNQLCVRLDAAPTNTLTLAFYAIVEVE